MNDTFAVRLDPEIDRKLRKLAEVTNRSRGWILRELVRQAQVPEKAELGVFSQAKNKLVKAIETTQRIES